MGPGNSEYGQYADWYERQQRRMAQLETENRDLRRQLDDLRRGIGVAVMIHGRPIPLAPLQPAGSAHMSDDPAISTGAHSAPQLYAWPVQQSPAPLQPAPAPATFLSEESWLTGPQRAARPSPQRERAPIEPPRPLTPSQAMTPSWLREEGPAAGSNAWQGAAWSDQHSQGISHSPPTPPRLKPAARPGTLAHITGRQPVAQPEPPPYPRRNPYADSFVLG